MEQVRTIAKNNSWMLWVVLWAVLLTVIGQFSVAHFPPSWHAAAAPNYRDVSPFMRWDALHYVDIAARGYTTVSESGFFPGYPLLLRVVHSIVPVARDWLGSVLSLTAFIAGLWFIRNLEAVRRRSLAPWITAFAVTLPMSFFFIAPMSESLLWFSTGMLLFSLERRRFPLATIAVALAVVSRPVGLVLLIPFIWTCITERWRWTFAAVIIVFLPLIAWDFYLFTKLGTFIGPLQSQLIPGQRSIGIPFSELFALPRSISLAPNPVYRVDAFVQALAVATAAAGLYGVKKTLAAPWFLACCIALIGIYGSGTLAGTDRYVMTFAPFVIGLAALPWRTARYVAIGLGAGFLVINTVLFSLWCFIA
ncbi:MAG: hypothetical protein V1685_03060 [Parcubacteria group bacterium]